MDLIRFSMTRPVTVAVGVILVVMFGLIGLGAIPIQLTPTVDRPIITVTTRWPGRSPQEVVDEITKEQEERLKNVSNLRTMRSLSSEGQSVITLEFHVGAAMTRALQDVSDSLRQVPEYPEEVDEPTIKASEGAAENAVAWFIIDVDPAKKALHPGYDITTLFQTLDREVKPFLERVDGVAEVNVIGGRDREVRVLLDPVALAQRGLSHQQVIDALRGENRNISAGTIAEGKRDYRVRVIGQFQSADEVLDTVIAFRAPGADGSAGGSGTGDGMAGLAKPVFVRDVGKVEIGYVKQRGFVRSVGEASIAMNVIRQSGSNVMSVMRDLRRRIEEVRSEILPRIDPVVGPDLRLRQVYDETTYIESAIGLVLQNLWIGGSLAVLTLLVFLRSFKSTLVIAMSIPISVIGTFLVMLVSGRTLNVISLAGLAFATGMVVDNAVVVLENIERRRSLGDAPLAAVHRGAREVWGAVLASTLTTVAVFLPLLTIREEAGQLFFDLTLALAVSVTLSMVVAVTVVPAASALLLRKAQARDIGGHGHGVRGLFGLAGLMERLTDGFARLIFWLMSSWRGWTLRPGLILGMTALSILGSWGLTPPMDYLPAGNRNLVFGGLLIPPGLSIEQRAEIARRIEESVAPYIKARMSDPQSMRALAPIPQVQQPGSKDKPVIFDPVGVENFFIGAFGSGMFVGGTSQSPQVVIPLGHLLTGAMNAIPDTYGGASQASIFGRGVGGGNSLNLEISGPSIDRVITAAKAMFGASAARFGYSKVQANPSNFNLTQQEWRLKLTDAGRELGLTTERLGVAARGLFDGAFAGDYILDGRKVDLMVLPLGGRLAYKERLASIPVATPAGRIVPIDSIVTVEPTAAPQEVQRIEELPSVTVQIKPREDQALGSLMAEVEEEIVGPARRAGLIDKSMRIRLEGSAAKLDEVRASLFGARPVGADADFKGWRKGLASVGGLVLLAGLVASIAAFVRGLRRGRAGEKRASMVYGAVGLFSLGLVLGGLATGVALEPQLITARFIWALMVTFLLMAALFESFLYPFVIMFTVPLATVGGFAALRLVHEWTLLNPTLAPQQLDILTMIGFVILIGTVVNNAILLVEQALNFMNPTKVLGAEASEDEAMPPLRAIAESVRTRVRPIFMTTLTTLGGGLPLVVAPGAGSEMYRGLGAVVVGGLLVSSVFTLVLTPMLFSLVLEMREGALRLLGAHHEKTPSTPIGGKPATSTSASRKREMELV